MAQHDYNIANQTGLEFRADLNNMAEAIVTQNSGPTEPTVTYAGMKWLDTSTSPPIEKRRNAANSAWETTLTEAGQAVAGASDAAAQRTAMGAQETLVSGTNIKTVGGQGLLGSGDIGLMPGFRNKIINGKMEVAQRGTSGTSTNAYAIDRWILYHAGTAPTWVRTTGGGLLNEHFSDLLEIVGAAGNTGINLNQRIESLNSADLCGKTVTFSAYVLHTNTGGPRNFVIAAQHPNNVDNWGSSVTQIGNSGNIYVPFNVWTRITWTTTLPASGPNLGLSFEIICQSVVATQSIYITGVQLEVGSVATPFEHRPYGIELELCQRYYQNIIGSPAAGCVAASNKASVSVLLPTTMRAVPTVSFERYADWSIHTGLANIPFTGHELPPGGTVRCFELELTGLSGGSPGQVAQLRTYDVFAGAWKPSARIRCDSEL